MNEVNEQQVRRLDEMDEQQARHFLEELYSVLSAEKEYELRHEDYVMEMPQSGERFRGRENMRGFQRAFPSHSNPPSIQIRRVLVRDGLWVKEAVVDYGEGRVFNSVQIIELKDGKMWRDTRYYAEPFEAPEWRAQWVERMETGAPPRYDSECGTFLRQRKVVTAIMFLDLTDALLLGLGVSFLIFGLSVLRRVSPDAKARAWAMYLSIGYLTVSWWPHLDLHAHNGTDLQGLLVIDYPSAPPAHTAIFVLD